MNPINSVELNILICKFYILIYMYNIKHLHMYHITSSAYIQHHREFKTLADNG